MQGHRILKAEIAANITRNLAGKGFEFVKEADHDLSPDYALALNEYRQEYENFPTDPHLNPGEGFRARRYGRFELNSQSGELRVFPHDAFYQSAHFDVLYGDIHRRFAPLNARLLQNRFFLDLIRDDFYSFPLSETEKDQTWEINTHLIRIAAVPGNSKGRPAPEGIHQDGYHYGVSRLFDRSNLNGAESRIHNLEKDVIERHTLTQPTDAVYMNDRAIFHSVEPFESQDPSRFANRDMLIALYQPLNESPQSRVDSLPLSPGGVARYLDLANHTLFQWLESEKRPQAS